jgi:hypothetical protein
VVCRLRERYNHHERRTPAIEEAADAGPGSSLPVRAAWVEALLVHAGVGPRRDGALALCVTRVLDERVVGGDIFHWVSPTIVEVRSHRCFETVQHRYWRARRWRELTARTTRDCKWAVPTISRAGRVQAVA